jgi:Methyltransferase domain
MSLPNWFTPTERPSFVRFTEEFVGQEDVHALQLGAFAGDVTCWLLEHVLTGTGSSIDDVDTWGGSPNADERSLDFGAVEARYDLRTATFSADGRLRKWKSTTAAFFAALPEDRTYDLVVVDADHHAASVLEDAIAAFHHLVPLESCCSTTTPGPHPKDSSPVPELGSTPSARSTPTTSRFSSVARVCGFAAGAEWTSNWSWAETPPQWANISLPPGTRSPGELALEPTRTCGAARSARRPVKAEVAGSNPVRSAARRCNAKRPRSGSSVGRARA